MHVVHARGESHDDARLERHRHVVPRVREELGGERGRGHVVEHLVGELREHCGVGRSEEADVHGHARSDRRQSRQTGPASVIRPEMPSRPDRHAWQSTRRQRTHAPPSDGRKRVPHESHWKGRKALVLSPHDRRRGALAEGTRRVARV
jgi:hypothetical protein